jgi:beta-phosphoglucomutase-like phosphatase (HAD superfamily)
LPRAIVFDFDGVIANSEPLHFRAFRDVLADDRVDLSESDYYGRYLGFDDRGVFREVARDRGLPWTPGRIDDLIRRKAVRLEALERDVSVLFPGAREAIGRFAPLCPLAIASGALRDEILRVLDHEDLRKCFAVIVAAEDTPASKPAPDPYLRAVRELAAVMGAPLAASECVAIEDSKWGIESARRAGLRAVAITNTYPADAISGAELIVDHLDTLTWELLSSLDGRV